MLFVAFGGEPSAYVQEHPPHPHGDRVARGSMELTVGALTVLAALGGWLQFAGIWTPVTDWLEPVARPLVEASGAKEVLASVLAVVFGAAGIAVAWWIYAVRRAHAPRPSRVLERKFYVDELYDVLFFYPAVAISRALYWVIEGPLVGGSITGIAELARWTGGRVRELQSGLVRAYALALAAGVALLVLVFVAVR
jgi:NADH-quinone oxidoreductase subunit L